MTFFLPTKEPQTPVAAPGKKSTAGEIMGAGFTVEEIETDARGRRFRERSALLAEMRAEMGDAFEENLHDFPTIRRGNMAQKGVNPKTVFVLQKLAAQDPAKWGRFPQTEEAINAEVTKRLQAEHEDAMDVLGMGGVGTGTFEFLGRGGSGLVDETNLLLAPLGGFAGGVARTMAVEAGLGVVGEALTLPRQQQVSDELNLPDPNIAVQLTTAGVFSGAAAGAFKAIGKGAGYVRTRRAASRADKPDSVSATEFDAAIDEAQTALAAGKPVPPPPAINDGSLNGLVKRIVGVESGGNPRAKSKTSSAGGLGQFIDSTWLTMIKRYRPDVARGKADVEILRLKFNPELNFQMTARYTQENLDGLRNAGLPHGAGELYLAHFAGQGGAKTILRGDPDAHISTVMGPDKIRANAGIKFAGKHFPNWSVRDLRRWAEHKMGQTPDPGDSFGVTTRAGYTRPGEVTTGTGTRIDVEYEVIDATLLRAASGDLQPRDRSRASSDEQIAEIAARLDPARLMPGPEADRGTPIIGPDNVVESGNGRVAAIAQAKARFGDRYEAYVETIKAAGFPIPEGVDAPVLVARRTSPLDDAGRQQFVRDANASTLARFSATEQAGIDASVIDEATLPLHRAGAPLTSPENRAFVQSVLGRISQAERSGLVDAKGALNADGVRRIRQALFANAYDAPDLIGRFAEDSSSDIRGITDALADAAPDWAGLKAEIAAGRIRPEMDTTDNLMDAIRLVADARETARSQGVSVSGALSDALAQTDLLNGSVDAVTAAFVRVLYKGNRARSSADVSEILRNYVQEARNVGKTDAGLFGDTIAPNPKDVINAVTKTPGEDLFTPQSGAIPAGGDGIGQRVDQGGQIPKRSGLDQSSGRPEEISVEGVNDRQFEDGANSPAILSANKQSIDALKADLAENDFDITLPDGQTYRASELLDDVAADVELADVLKLCNAGGGA